MNRLVYRAALLTPASVGAIAVIRLSGSDPIQVLQPFIRNYQSVCENLRPGRLTRAQLSDGCDLLDDVVIGLETISATEQSADICCHGGIRIVQRILQLLQKADVVLDPGSKAFQGPDATTLEREAVQAVREARTLRAALHAGRLRVELPRRIEQLMDQVHLHPDRLSSGIADLMRDSLATTTLLDGVAVALIGPPNSGKSTLFNTLIGRKSAVTSPVPGTTRDWVSEAIEASGLHMTLIDTAGRHFTHNRLEKQAIEAGIVRARQIQGALLVLDASQALPMGFLESLKLSASKTWVVANKCDLGLGWSGHEVAALQARFGGKPIFLSAQTGEGLSDLKVAILEHFGLADPDRPALSLFTPRQIELATEIRRNPEAANELLQKLLSDSAGVPAR